VKTADLHTHTFYSDGTESPERVVELAKNAGLSAIALTDHDNTESMAIAQPAADRLGLELIPGIEMSAATQNLEVHILGLFIDFAHPPLVEHLKVQQQRRVHRVHEMTKRLAAVGVRIEADEVLQLAGMGTVGRPHVARILLKRGYVTSLPEAFDKYLGPKSAGFVPGSTVAPAEIIKLIRGAGGAPVLAHPVFLKKDALIDDFTRQGLAGLEVYHSSHTPEQVRQYEMVADRLKLLPTGGSDFHGAAKGEGSEIGTVKVPYDYVDALRRWTAAQTR
jgi:3',5'-nucleoside bisphosphate phosphatase